MLRRYLLALLASLVLLGSPASAQEFPKLTGRVVDAAKLLSPEQVAQLTQLSSEVEAASTRQLVVATIPDLQGYDVADYGYRLGREWKIGQGQANNGILLVVAPKERKVRIEVGYGLEPIMTDAMSSSIIQDIILPRFRDQDIPGGIVAGTQAIAEQMKLPLEAAEARAKAASDKAGATRAQRNRSGSGGGVPFGLIFWGALLLFVIVPALFGGRGRGKRRYRGRGGGGSAWPIILFSIADEISRSGRGGGGGWGGGGGGWGGGGGGGFSGGGGSFGGGGASGSW